jgi:hypothetical protein
MSKNIKNTNDLVNCWKATLDNYIKENGLKLESQKIEPATIKKSKIEPLKALSEEELRDFALELLTENRELKRQNR